ncbi:MAG: metal-dependent hydrolase [Candidatus Thiodiazotropha sp. (ex Epidulcina cf. delphinae)]|nr:metal-dependent hydrolase [Candidatus Thiodiazotropha sp. (ex Epidulcina cf. delphinae)]
MIIGHLPAGYVFAEILARKLSNIGVDHRHLVLIGVLGAIAPDLDMLYFYLVDNGQRHHHTYWSHYPVVWLGLLAASVGWHRLALNKSRTILAIVFSAGGFMHLLLDTIVGDIWWLAPFLNQPYAMFTVPALYTPWWLNFILHWSFALELLLTLWAIVLWRRKAVLL